MCCWDDKRLVELMIYIANSCRAAVLIGHGRVFRGKMWVPSVPLKKPTAIPGSILN
jgi:hypothetical protein